MQHLRMQFSLNVAEASTNLAIWEESVSPQSSDHRYFVLDHDHGMTDQLIIGKVSPGVSRMLTHTPKIRKFMIFCDFFSSTVLLCNMYGTYGELLLFNLKAEIQVDLRPLSLIWDVIIKPSSNRLRSCHCNCSEPVVASILSNLRSARVSTCFYSELCHVCSYRSIVHEYIKNYKDL